MELLVGKTAGFCFGVRNAVDKTYEHIRNTEKLFCLGELVHNETVIENLKKSGVVAFDNIEDIPNNSNVIIRAHGETPEIYEKAKAKNINLIDLTCPKVSKIHDMAKEFSENKYYIMLIAENKHPETIGTRGYCGDNCSIIENVEDIDNAINKYNQSHLEKIAIIAQTTFSLDKFNKIVDEIKSKTECEVEVKNTICNATAMRQAETEELSKIVDLMIIIGGKSSANTKRLYEISLKNCKKAILIQNKDDEELKEILKNNFNKIGIMAGASTPKESIDEVVNYLGGKNEYSK